MQEHVIGDWASNPIINRKANRTAMTEIKGHTGNVVPFFPAEWKKNANDVFNLIMSGKEPTEAAEETTHAAIYKKPETQSVSPFLQQKIKEIGNKTESRPTSGKHYARERNFSNRKRELEPPNKDPEMSSVAKNFEKSKKVEGLLNKLALYMAGEIPDTDDLAEIFDTTTDQNDDATTAYTKDDYPKHKGLDYLS